MFTGLDKTKKVAVYFAPYYNVTWGDVVTKNIAGQEISRERVTGKTPVLKIGNTLDGWVFVVQTN